MAKVVDTSDGWFVVTKSTGRKIAGPFPKRVEALQAMDDTPALVVRHGAERKGCFVANEETGAHVSEYFRSYEDAVKDMEKRCPTVKNWTPVARSEDEAPKRRGRPPSTVAA